MSSVKDIILTFDYEMYLGSRTGSVLKCMIEPTEQLCVILERHKAKAVFFVDVLCLKQLETKEEFKNDLNLIIQQLRYLQQEGHYVFPHLHPHWKDAVYISDEKQFDLSNLTHYSLDKIEAKEVDTLFKDSIKYLIEIGVNCEQWGYRAGGWCIQPFEKYYDAFSVNQIYYDFSVMPGYKNDDQNQRFDYMNVKTDKPYRFERKVECAESDGKFVEFPISMISYGVITKWFDRVILKYLWKTNDRGWGDGISASSANIKTNENQMEMLSMDTLTYAKLSACKRMLEKNRYMQWISHPKMFTRHGLRMMDKFLSDANKTYTVNFDFKKVPTN